MDDGTEALRIKDQREEDLRLAEARARNEDQSQPRDGDGAPAHLPSTDGRQAKRLRGA